MTRRRSPALLHAVNSTGATAADVRMCRSNAGSINVHVCCNPVQPAVACCGATPVVLWGEIDFSESRVAANSRDVDEVNRNAVLNLRGLPYKITNRGLGSVTFPPPLQLLPLFRFTKCAVRALFRYCFLAAAAQPLSFFPGFALPPTHDTHTRHHRTAVQLNSIAPSL